LETKTLLPPLFQCFIAIVSVHAGREALVGPDHDGLDCLRHGLLHSAGSRPCRISPTRSRPVPALAARADADPQPGELVGAQPANDVFHTLSALPPNRPAGSAISPGGRFRSSQTNQDVFVRDLVKVSRGPARWPRFGSCTLWESAAGPCALGDSPRPPRPGIAISRWPDRELRPNSPRTMKTHRCLCGPSYRGPVCPANDQFHAPMTPPLPSFRADHSGSPAHGFLPPSPSSFSVGARMNDLARRQLGFQRAQRDRVAHFK